MEYRRSNGPSGMEKYLSEENTCYSGPAPSWWLGWILWGFYENRASKAGYKSIHTRNPLPYPFLCVWGLDQHNLCPGVRV